MLPIRSCSEEVFYMSVLGELAAKRFWLAVFLTAAVMLAVTAIGAMMTVAGIVPVEKAWVAGCAAWLLGGWLGGRSAAKGKDRRLVRSILNVAITAALFWAVGLTAPEKNTFALRCWPWHLVCGFLGAVVAVIMPQKQKRRRRGKKGR